MSSTSERLREKWSKLPSESLRSMLADGRINKESAPIARLILEERESKTAATAEAARVEREEEMLRIARLANEMASDANRIADRALRRSTIANIWAAIAALIAAITTYIAYADSRCPNNRFQRTSLRSAAEAGRWTSLV